MTVKELIMQLKKFKADSEVRVALPTSRRGQPYFSTPLEIRQIHPVYDQDSGAVSVDLYVQDIAEHGYERPEMTNRKG